MTRSSRSTRGWMAAAAIGCVALAAVGARTAQAGDAYVRCEVKLPDPKDPKGKGDGPRIEVTVIGAPDLPTDKFTLVDISAKPPVQLKATSRRAYSQGNEPVAIAIVMLGWEQWIGNDSYLPASDPTRTKGVLDPLRAALDKLDLKGATPAGSLGMVVTYGMTAKIRLPMGPIEKLRGAALGTQKDYHREASFELAKGMELALAELGKATTPRKVLLVLTDGNDTNPDAMKAKLTTLKRQAQGDRVEISAIVYKAADSGPGNLVAGLTPRVSTVTTLEGLAPALQAVVKSLSDRQYLTFPGTARGKQPGLAWDGKWHELMLMIGKDETDPQPVILPKATGS